MAEMENVMVAMVDDENNKDKTAAETDDKKPAATKGPFDTRYLDVDLDALTFGHIDWEKAHGSIVWLADRVKEMCEQEGKEKMENFENGLSQYMAKTCVMHVIHTFHVCRYDAPIGAPVVDPEIVDGFRVPAPASEHAEESTPTPPPSGSG